MHTKDRILERRIFVNKRPGLVIELPDCELHPYVLDGYARCAAKQHPAAQHKRQITTVQFNGWQVPFETCLPATEGTRHYGWTWDAALEMWTCKFEIVFRMIDNPDVGRESQRKPDVLAISFDGCRTFENNMLCQLVNDYKEYSPVAV